MLRTPLPRLAGRGGGGLPTVRSHRGHPNDADQPQLRSPARPTRFHDCVDRRCAPTAVDRPAPAKSRPIGSHRPTLGCCRTRGRDRNPRRGGCPPSRPPMRLLVVVLGTRGGTNMRYPQHSEADTSSDPASPRRSVWSKRDLLGRDVGTGHRSSTARHPQTSNALSPSPARATYPHGRSRL